MKQRFYTRLALILLVVFAFSACSSDDDPVIPPTGTEVYPNESVKGGIEGLFLLNQGQMGRNNASIDYYSYKRGWYVTDMFESRNPEIQKGLGDIGNDFQIYDDKLFAVMNGSNIIEVMDVRTLKHIGEIKVERPRFITFKDNFAYVSCYRGPEGTWNVEDESEFVKGVVVKIDLNKLEIAATCEVGYYPEGVAISGNSLYVVNSGMGDYRLDDKSVSVVDLATFKEKTKITVAENLSKMSLYDGKLYVISQGNYYDVPADVYVVNPMLNAVERSLGIQAGNMDFYDNMLFASHVEYGASAAENKSSFVLYDLKQGAVIEGGFIKDGTDKDIKSTYFVAVHPTGEYVYVGDSGDFVKPGRVYCYDNNGTRLWGSSTGVGPSHVVFTKRALSGI